MPPDGKIKTIEELAQIIKSLRAEQKKVVHCHGVFDLLHIGHIRYFEQARRLGDVLVVTVTPDRYVDKGPHRPAFPENRRVEGVVSLGVVDLSGIKSVATGVVNEKFFINQIIKTTTSTIPGAFLGISGRPMVITLPISIIIILYYMFGFYRFAKEKSFPKIFIISNIILPLLFFKTIPWYPSRYIIIIVPFTLLTIATYFKDNKKLRIFLRIALLLTFSISLFRLVFWDSIYFGNNKAVNYVQKNIVEPYVLISQDLRYSYYILNKISNNINDINKDAKIIVILGNHEYINSITKRIERMVKIDHIENVLKKSLHDIQ